MSSKHRNENAPSYLKVNINILLGWELSALRRIIIAWQLKRENSLNTEQAGRFHWRKQAEKKSRGTYTKTERR